MVAAGVQRKGQPERCIEPRQEVGLGNSTDEAAEGNEAAEGRTQPERNSSKGGKPCTQG
jgi:hypothetical protein